MQVFVEGQRVRLPGRNDYQTVDVAQTVNSGWKLILVSDTGELIRANLTLEQAEQVSILEVNGNAQPKMLLAGLWAEWMRAATVDAKATALASSPLRPYVHQSNAVYGAMLPQPRLRFLLADEPGTGKTIMAGLYLREMQRLGLIRRALIVAPAHLVSKWGYDFDRFFGGGLKRIRATTVQEGGLQLPHDLWIVSLELAAANPSVQEALRPDIAGWDAVIFDEAHRLTPTAQSLYRVGKLLSRAPRALLMTATPHRGKEHLFRALLHLVDPDIYPEPNPQEAETRLMKPGRIHFLRRMKEDLIDYDGETRLFKGRYASNEAVSLSAVEAAFYEDALMMVQRYFPTSAIPLGQMVYGKRAASSLYALRETLRRRRENMGAAMPAVAAMDADPDWEDAPTQDEARIVYEQSRYAKQEKSDLSEIIARLDRCLTNSEYTPTKWPRLLKKCFEDNGIRPGNGEQAVVFTEYADTADWLVTKLQQAGYSAKRYSGRDDHPTRDQIRQDFAQRNFQILVSTDAGNEGIDLQTAHVLVNWDIPWSLVRLEQRMGRIHRVGQTRDVRLFNLIATDTREGEVLQVLLENFTVAANGLGGRIFDSLSVVAERVGLDMDQLLSHTYGGGSGAQIALAAAQAVTPARIEAAAQQTQREENVLRETVDVASAVAALQTESLERINPRIVEAFFKRVEQAGLYTFTPSTSGEGLFLLKREDARPLPPAFHTDLEARALVASSVEALRVARAGGLRLERAICLGPSEVAFRELVADLQNDLRPALFQGGTLWDQSGTTGYDLFLYEAAVSESSGRRRTLWPFLVRVDNAGARTVRWEMLANLTASPGNVQDELPASTSLHPAREADADARAVQIVQDEEHKRRGVLKQWLASARRELERIPDAQLAQAVSAEQRRVLRPQLTRAVQSRLSEMEAMTEVQIEEPRRLGWARVLPAGPPHDPTEADSEMIAVAFVGALLRADGWTVADVQTEGRGYDLHARRGRLQRCVEVKGIWKSAASTGVRLTGNEVLMARQIGTEYVLYVVDDCSNGNGTLFGVYPNPAETFGDLMRDVSVYQVPGSALRNARIPV